MHGARTRLRQRTRPEALGVGVAYRFGWLTGEQLAAWLERTWSLQPEHSAGDSERNGRGLSTYGQEVDSRAQKV